MKNIGYDAEFFLLGGRGYIPAERVLRGTKGNACALGEGVVGHPDNIMAEIASAAPFHHEDLVQRIRNDMGVLRRHVAPVEVQITPSITVTEAFLGQSTLAGEVGCDVDYKDGMPRDPITAEVLGNQRHAGGHIHFDASDSVPPEYCASVCDIMLAVPLIAMGEHQAGRRATYGLPGLYRPKPYGLEYRTLSNYWVSVLMQDTPDCELFNQLVAATANAFINLDDRILSLPQRYMDYASAIVAAEDQNEAANFVQVLKGVLK